MPRRLAPQRRPARGGCVANHRPVEMSSETCDDRDPPMHDMPSARVSLIELASDEPAAVTLDLSVPDADRIDHHAERMLWFGQPPPTETS